MEVTGPQRAMENDEIQGAAPLPHFRVGGLRVDAVNLDDAVDLLLKPSGGRAVHLCNAYTVSLASQDAGLAVRINRGALNLIDGTPLMWLARRRGHRHMTARVCGPDVMRACLDRGRSVGTRHFLYGSTPEVLDALEREIAVQWPGAEIVGSESPPFREFADEEIAEAVARFDEAAADIVWVGLGTPKQDIEVDRLAAVGGATYIAIGAAFDFIAGNKKQPPAWVQKIGMEWSFRLISEPRRLWKRYLVGNARFLAAAWKSR